MVSEPHTNVSIGGRRGNSVLQNSVPAVVLGQASGSQSDDKPDTSTSTTDEPAEASLVFARPPDTQPPPQ